MSHCESPKPSCHPVPLCEVFTPAQVQKINQIVHEATSCLHKEVCQLQNTVGALSSTVVELRTAVNCQEGKIHTLEKSLCALHDRVVHDEKCTVNSIETLQCEVNKLSHKVCSLQEQVAVLAAKDWTDCRVSQLCKDVKCLAEADRVLQGEICDLKRNVQCLADGEKKLKCQVDHEQQSICTISKQVGVLACDIEKVAAKTCSLQKQINKLKCHPAPCPAPCPLPCPAPCLSPVSSCNSSPVCAPPKSPCRSVSPPVSPCSSRSSSACSTPVCSPSPCSSRSCSPAPVPCQTPVVSCQSTSPCQSSPSPHHHHHHHHHTSC